MTVDDVASLAEVHNGVGKVHGIKVGAIAAIKMVASWRNDGRDAIVAQPPESVLLAEIYSPALEAGGYRIDRAQDSAPVSSSGRR